MKKLSYLGNSVTALAFALSAVTTVSSSTTANVTQPSNLNASGRQDNVLLAQGLVGQCRAAKQQISIYSDRSTTSKTVRTLAANQEVTLADTGTGGWIAVSAPVAGYVQTRDLKLCATGSKPVPTTGSVCRVPKIGLAIRQNPAKSAVVIGGVGPQDTVRLVDPRESQKDADGRTWIRISAPVAGWISSGFPEGNLNPEFNCK
jgi:hypothetical protein